MRITDILFKERLEKLEAESVEVKLSNKELLEKFETAKPTEHKISKEEKGALLDYIDEKFWRKGESV